MVDMLSTSRNDPIDKIGVGICMHDIQQSRWKAYLKKMIPFQATTLYNGEDQSVETT